MDTNGPGSLKDKIAALEEELSRYRSQLDTLENNLRSLKNEASGKTPQPTVPVSPPATAPGATPIQQSPFHHPKANQPRQTQPVQGNPPSVPFQPSVQTVRKASKSGDVESFIGQRIASIIGIVILVAGLAFGIKYAIDANLVTPVLRIVGGFVAGTVLIAIAFRLKKDMLPLSAIILSGGLAVLYFSTFAGFNYYQLYPKLLAFILMALITAFGVLAASIYNLQIIGILGLTGAYSVPFLLSDGSGHPAVLFTYMAIINLGILYLTFRKNWLLLENISFYLTWLIFGVWYLSEFVFNLDVSSPYSATAAIFSTLFFLLFYAVVLFRNLKKEQKTHFTDILRTASNSLFFFLTAGHLVDVLSQERFTGLFTLANAIFHFGLAALLFRKKLADKRLLYTLLVLVITFVTISFAIELDGPWVTVFWGMEALLLFWVGRKTGASPFTTLASLLVVPFVISIIHDWENYYNFNYFYNDIQFHFLRNGGFVTTLFSTLIFTALWLMNRSRSLKGEVSGIAQVMAGMIAPILAVMTLYFGIYLEISSQADMRMMASAIQQTESAYTDYDYSILTQRAAILNIFSLIYFSIVCFIQPFVGRSSGTGWMLFSVSAFVLLISLVSGLNSVGDLRQISLTPEQSVFAIPASYGYLHYIFYVAYALLLGASWFNIRRNLEEGSSIRILWFYFTNLLALVVLSHFVTQLFMGMGTDDIYRMKTISFRAGYSILWALYSLFLIGYGMKADYFHARLAGFILLAIVVLKLLLMDTTRLPVLARVTAFVAVGILLLLVSWLYYRRKSAGEKNDEQS